MTLFELSLAMLTLLVTPGPTNTLLALAGTQRVPRAYTLPLVELAAYLAVVTPLALWGAAALLAVPALKAGLTMAAALWVAALAVCLWRKSFLPDASGRALVTPLQVGLTTLLNPKGLVFGLVLIPAGPSPVQVLMAFSGLVLGVSILWLALGASLSLRLRPLVNRGGALWLAVLAVLLAGRAMAG